MSTAAILGLGVRGQAWAELLAGAGWTVRLFDPVPGLAEATAARITQRAAGATVVAVETISACVAGADWIAECAPDRAFLKHKLYELVQRRAGPRAILATAAVVFTTETLRTAAPKPDQLLIARLDRGRGRVRLIAAPGVGAGLLAFAERLLRESGIPTTQEPERPQQSLAAISRPKVVRLPTAATGAPASATRRNASARPRGTAPRR